MITSSHYGKQSSWAFGIVEDINDPKQAGRVRVRIFGLDSPDRDVLPVGDLPWSTVMMPTNQPAMVNVGALPVGIQTGSMVTGFFLDGESNQNFLVVGSIYSAKAPATVVDEDVVDSNPEFIYRFLTEDLQFSEIKSAAIVGTVAHVLNDTNIPTDKEINGRYGIGQWQDSDKQALKAFAQSLNKKSDDLSTQCQFLASTLDNDNFRLSVDEETVEEYSDAFVSQYLSQDATNDTEQRYKTVNAALHTFRDKGSTGMFSFLDRKDFLEVGDTIDETSLRFRMAGVDRKITFAVIHHTATAPDQLFGAKKIDTSHKNRGWDGIGYHFVIRRTGDIEIGRDINRTGAHALDYNTGSIGIALEGGRPYPDGEYHNSVNNDLTDVVFHERADFTSEQDRALETLMKVFLDTFPSASVFGHYETELARRRDGKKSSGKADPNFDVQKWIKGKFPNKFEINRTPVAYVAGTSGVASSSSVTNTSYDNASITPKTPESVHEIVIDDPEKVSFVEATEGVEEAPDTPITLADPTEIVSPQSISSPSIDTGGIGDESVDTDTIDLLVQASLGASLAGVLTMDNLNTTLSGYVPSSDYTAENILSKVLTQDGTDSGLDADLLDGYHGAYYLDANNFVNMPASFSGSWDDLSNKPSITPDTDNTIRIQSDHGYVDIGPLSSLYCHFQTDRTYYHFNKEIRVSNRIRVYNSNTRLESTAAYVNNYLVYHEGNVASFLRSDRDTYFNTATNARGLYITRLAETVDQSVRFGVDDSRIYMSARQDESAFCGIRFEAIRDSGQTDNTAVMEFVNSSSTGVNLTIDGDKVWTEGNDGDSSGLNADLLDGSHLEDILDGTVSHSMLSFQAGTGAYQVGVEDNYFRWRMGGTSSPQGLRLDVYDTEVWRVDRSGSMTIAGTLTENSDRSLKKNITDLEDALSIVEKIVPRRFDWKSPDRLDNDIGVIAQELEEAIPVLTRNNPNGKMSVDYSRLSVVAIAAIKEQQREIDELRTMMTDIKHLLGDDHGA